MMDRDLYDVLYRERAEGADAVRMAEATTTTTPTSVGRTGTITLTSS